MRCGVLNLGEIADGIPVQRAGAAAEVREVAAATVRRQEFFSPPIFRRSGLPDRVEILMQEITNALLEGGTGQHVAGRVNREEPVGGRAGLRAEPVLRGIEQAVGNR